jgi:phenylalanyl-tRNA synthetase alpha chain
LSEQDLSNDELATLEILKKRPQFVMLKKPEEIIRLTEEGERIQTILDSEKTSLDSIDENYAHSLTSDMLVSGKWKNIVFRPLDVESITPLLFPGRTNPLIDLIEEIREAFVSLGFVEIEGNYIQSSFWNFDALFTPQDHAAREMQDTFYLRFEKDDGLENKKIVRNVSEAHNKGWNYKWKTSEAKRAVLRTHTTPVTLKYLAKKKPFESKIFTIGRVFRNEKVSYKHLVEFHQIEGVVTGQNISLRNLMGIQLEFYKKIGITKVKFWPTFFPYTEPSLQSMIYNERLDKWIELFGMGIFRPEVIEPLGIKYPVLAWGGGIERIAMLKYNLSDVRDLYNNKLGWLRGVQKFQL